MKRLFILNLIIILLVASSFDLVACSKDNLNKKNYNDQENKLTEESLLNEEIQLSEIKLTKYNYTPYLSISINQIGQTQTLMFNTYYVKYQLGWVGKYEFRYYTGLTPPTGKNVLSYSLLYSDYSVSTTFTVNCRQKKKIICFQIVVFHYSIVHHLVALLALRFMFQKMVMAIILL